LLKFSEEQVIRGLLLELLLPLRQLLELLLVTLELTSHPHLRVITSGVARLLAEHAWMGCPAKAVLVGAGEGYSDGIVRVHRGLHELWLDCNLRLLQLLLLRARGLLLHLLLRLLLRKKDLLLLLQSRLLLL